MAPRTSPTVTLNRTTLIRFSSVYAAYIVYTHISLSFIGIYFSITSNKHLNYDIIRIIRYRSGLSKDELYSITPLLNNPGIYSDPWGSFRTYQTTWNLVTYIDLNEFLQRRVVLAKEWSNLSDRCNNMTRACTVKRQIQALGETLKTLEKDQLQIKDLIRNYEEPQKDRKKRALVPPVGNIMNYLFGTLTEDDGKFYEKEIEKLKNDSKSMVELFKNQSILIKSEYNEQRIKLKNFAELSLNKFGNLTNAMKLLSSDLEDVKYNEVLIDIAMSLAHYIAEYRLDTTIMVDAILFAKQGQLHPRFLSPRRIIESAQAIKGKRPNSELPVPLENEFVAELLELSEMTIYQSRGFLIYIISVPLLHPKSYKLYRNIPLPIFQQSNSRRVSFAYIKPNSPFTAISENLKFYYRLDENELDDCKNTGKRFICKHLNALYRVDAYSDCEVKIIVDSNFHDFSACDVRVKTTAHTYWLRVHGTNQWVFSSATSETMHITCDDSEPQTLNINGTGILYLRPRCEAITSTIVLVSLDELSTNISTDFIPRGNLNISELLTFSLNPSNSLKIAELLRIVAEPTQLFADESAAAERDVQFQAIIDKADEILNRKTVDTRMRRIESNGRYSFLGLISLLIFIGAAWKFSLFSPDTYSCLLTLCKKRNYQRDCNINYCSDNQQATRVVVLREPASPPASAPSPNIIYITPAAHEVL